MIRSRWVFLKHVFFALLVLSSLLISAEIGLRWYDARTGKISRSRGGLSALEVKCWLVHHRMKPLQSVETANPDTGKPVRFSTNSLGLRAAEIAVPKPRGLFRILCLGDETTLAAEVEESQTFCAQLQRLLQKQTGSRVEVINAGVPGYCPLLSYLLLKHTLLTLQPDLIVLNFDMTDVADDHRLRRFVQVGEKGNALACRHPGLSSRKTRTARKRDRFLLATWARKKLGRLSTEGKHPRDDADIDSQTGRYAWLRDRSPDWSVYVQQAFEPIAAIERMCRELDVKLIVAACPAPWQISANASNTESVRAAAGVPRNMVYRSNAPFEQLERFLRKRGIRFCNPAEAFRNSHASARLYLRNAPRFSAAGHALYARELARCMQPLPSSTSAPPAWPRALNRP
ncbi:MAG: SGNH/GDSL hydrolase family protein [Planctomycetes bacterium]|nr:SGNH/GDSL hydrolase family protein [Planctomycetota bacterium]